MACHHVGLTGEIVGIILEFRRSFQRVASGRVLTIVDLTKLLQLLTIISNLSYLGRTRREEAAQAQICKFVLDLLFRKTKRPVIFHDQHPL